MLNKKQEAILKVLADKEMYYLNLANAEMKKMQDRDLEKYYQYKEEANIFGMLWDDTRKEFLAGN